MTAYHGDHADVDLEQYAQTVAELTAVLDETDVAALPEDSYAGLIYVLTTAPEAPALSAGGVEFGPMEPTTLKVRTAWYRERIQHFMDRLGMCVEEALLDPWVRVGAAQHHRDGSNADIHAWRCHMDQVHTALVALDQLLEATPCLLHEEH
ncbi:hypothetical protein [Mycolicibacterium obuense]|uniref:hypothetical protein n=1 Tax=Mycolicibacterium obuense TaxID=1807 RepID=UPI0023F8DE8E|nr:hypothetical protein [Mycolicibacterium obuense]